MFVSLCKDTKIKKISEFIYSSSSCQDKKIKKETIEFISSSLSFLSLKELQIESKFLKNFKNTSIIIN